MRNRKHWQTSKSTVYALVFLCTSLVMKLALKTWLGYYLTVYDYTYINDDYPQTWPIDRPSVQMAFGNSLRFSLDAPESAAEWAALVPGGDGVIHLGSHKQPYMVSMMHQLRCLDVVRAAAVRERGEGESDGGKLARHCLNYLKQMVLCRGDTHLESFQYASHEDPIDLRDMWECKDWGAVYDAVRENQAANAALQ